MEHSLSQRSLEIIAGLSYLVIFFAAIFANFAVLESIVKAPVETIQQNHIYVRAGIMAFMVTVIFDVVVAWSLYELFKGHVLSKLSVLFRMMHASIMAVAIYALVMTLTLNTADDILRQVDIFSNTWLIGLFFFGVHLVLLGAILLNKVKGKTRIIAASLVVAGVMYMIDTTAHFVLPTYKDYSNIFLALVAVSSILGEMSLAVWLLSKKEYDLGIVEAQIELAKP